MFQWLEEKGVNPDLNDFLGSIVLDATSNLLTYHLAVINKVKNNQKLTRDWFHGYYIHVLKNVFGDNDE